MIKPPHIALTLSTIALLLLTACAGNGGESPSARGSRAGDGSVPTASTSEPTETTETTETTEPTETVEATESPAPTETPTPQAAATSSAPPTSGADLELGEALVPPSQQGQSEVDIFEYVDFVVTNLDQMWSQFFAQQRMSEPFIEPVITGSQQWPTFQSDCLPDPITSTFANAIYCPLDGDGLNWSYGDFSTDQDNGAIVIPADSMVRLYNTGQIGEGDQTRQASVIGDLAVGYTVAHEFAHHIADEYARQYNLTAWLNDQPWMMQPVGKYAELFADCAAGLWIWSAQLNHLLEEGDVQEALETARAFGDLTYGGPDPHGTAEERYDAVLQGIQSGSWDSCVASYWKQDPTTDKNKDGIPDVDQNRSKPYPAGYPIPLEYLTG